MRQPLSRKPTLWIASVVVVADQLTKIWAANTLDDGPIEVIPWLLTFRLGRNTGAAFGILPGGGVLLGIVAVGAVALVLYIASVATRKLDQVALGLILGGTLGNLIDRMVRADGFLDGAVIDWIRLPNFPMFNLADASITVGAALLILGALRKL